jgi:hypothetical protein
VRPKTWAGLLGELGMVGLLTRVQKSRASVGDGGLVLVRGV